MPQTSFFRSLNTEGSIQHKCATFQPLQTCIVSSVHGCWPSERVFSGLSSTAQPRRRRTECKAEWHRKRFPNNFIHLSLMCSTCLAFIISPPALRSRDTLHNPAVFNTPAASVTSCTYTVCLYRDSTSQILNTCCTVYPLGLFWIRFVSLQWNGTRWRCVVLRASK